MKSLHDCSIKRKMVVMTLLICGSVLFVAISSLFAFQILNFRSNYQRDTATLAAIVAGNSTAALAFRDAAAASEVMSSLQAKPSIESAYLATADGAIFARYGKEVRAAALVRYPRSGEFLFQGGRLLYTQPVVLEKKRLGTLYLSSDYGPTLRELLEIYVLVILGITAVSIGLAMILSGRLQRMIVDPILRLAETAQAVGERSDYSLRTAPSNRSDELGRLATSFNEMLERIEDQDQALKDSRERFAIAIAGANDGIWDWDLRSNQVFFSEQWKRIIGYSNDEVENTIAGWEALVHPDDLGPNKALLQNYLEGRLPSYQAEFRMREKSGRYRWILARGAAIWDADGRPGRMAGSLTDIDGRKEAEAEVQLAREKFETLVNSIDGIVWESDAETRFSYVSRQCERILGYSPEQWLAQPRFWQEHLHRDDADRAIQAGRDGIAGAKPYNCEYRMVAADGKTVWIHESGDVCVGRFGKPTLVRGVLRDITVQKHNAEQLDGLNMQLVEASRQAGMADVATGVLHNVGNVLNSVNVSTTLIHDKLHESEVVSLVRLGELVRQHEGDLPAFLRDDPKGKLVPKFLVQLGEQIAREHQLLSSEVQHLTRNVSHIKDIVATQQNYARVSGFIEPVAVSSLVDEALLLNRNSFSRHGVRVIREFSDLPTTMTDKHKILQILVNLLQNAKQAMADSERGDKQLRLQIAQSGPLQFTIRVTDNGIGIPAENLTRIFAHGFSTRKSGHGFGLHSAANAANEMGGQLRVHSAGSGTGATFTLELPLVLCDKQPKDKYEP